MSEGLFRGHHNAENVPEVGEIMCSRDSVVEISSVCGLSREPNLLPEVGRGTVVRPLEVGFRLSKDNDLSRDRADRALKRVELFSVERLYELHSVIQQLSNGNLNMPVAERIHTPTDYSCSYHLMSVIISPNYYSPRHPSHLDLEYQDHGKSHSGLVLSS